MFEKARRMTRPPPDTGMEQFFASLPMFEEADVHVVISVFYYLRELPETEKWSFKPTDCRFGTTSIPKSRRGRIFVAFGPREIVIPTFRGELLDREKDIYARMKTYIKSGHFYGDDAFVFTLSKDRLFVQDNLEDLKALMTAAYRICL